MKRFVCAALMACGVCHAVYADDEDLFQLDTSDPLYMVQEQHLLSVTGIEYGSEILRLGQAFAFGANDRLTLNADVHYQFDFRDSRGHRGFSGIGLGGIYRAGLAEDNSAYMTTDVLFGGYFGGNRYVREDMLFDTRLCKHCHVDASHNYARSSYFAGLRIGRQWTGVSLAGTVKSTWVFDDVRGMAFIDFSPEAYFRIVQGWRFGVGFVARFATDPDFDREWWRFRLLRQYGRTQYGATFSYEYETEESMVGMNLNLLF